MTLTHARRPEAGSQRERILDAATALFAELGFEAMTMRKLGEAVGLDNSSLYRHVASKTDLANAVLDRVVDDVLPLIEAVVDGSRPASLKAVEVLAAAAGGHFFDRPADARLMMHWIMSVGEDGGGFSVSVPASDTGRPGGRLLELLAGWLEGGVREGALRKHAVPDALIVLLGAILLRPATFGHLLSSLEPERSRVAARDVWMAELRATVRGTFAP